MKFTFHIVLLIGSIVLSSCGAAQSKNTAKADQSQAVQIAKPTSPELPVSKQSPAVENRTGKAIDLSHLSQEEKENLLFGDWMIFFPTPNQNWGFGFKRDHRFNYVDNSAESLKQRYRWTSGKWRLSENTIEIQIASYTIQDHDPIEGPFGLNFPPESKSVQKDVENETWVRIGTLESLHIGLVRAGIEYPPRITLLPLFFDRVKEKSLDYYQFTND